jgi:hypothetical protein
LVCLIAVRSVVAMLASPSRFDSPANDASLSVLDGFVWPIALGGPSEGVAGEWVVDGTPSCSPRSAVTLLEHGLTALLALLQTPENVVGT